MTAILTYHHIGEQAVGDRKSNLYVSLEAFEDQLRFLRDHGIEIVSLDRLRAGLLDEEVPPRRSVAITFDDGFEDNFTRALPMLKKYDATATFFMITGKIGETDERGGRYMTAEQLRAINAAGMTIGSHTVTHPWLAKLPIEQARREMADSKAALEKILDKPVRWLCYPSGSFSSKVVAEARELGYAGACSVIRDNRTASHQLFYLPRVMVMPTTSLLRFRYYFSGLYHFVHERKNRKRWSRRL